MSSSHQAKSSGYTRIIPITREDADSHNTQQSSVLIAKLNGENVGVGPGTLYASIKDAKQGSQAPIKPGDPRVNKLVYNMYRGLLNTKHSRANDIVDSAPKPNVYCDEGVGDRVAAMMRQQADLKEGKMSTTGGPPPPPPPPPFQVPGASGSAPKPVAEPTPVRSMPAAPAQGTVPAALAGAMMKDKKPFTYTPGGLDLSEIKSPRMQRRLQRNASLEGVKPSPLAQQSSSPGPTPAMPPSGMVQVLPTAGMSMVPKPKEVQKTPINNCGPPPPPPPFGVEENHKSSAKGNSNLVEKQQHSSAKDVQPILDQRLPANETARVHSAKDNASGVIPDANSEVTGTSSPSYPDDLNSLHNRSEESMDVNTISPEMELAQQNPPRLTTQPIQVTPTLAQGSSQFERPLPVRHEAAPPLSQHSPSISYSDAYQQQLSDRNQTFSPVSPPTSPMVSLSSEVTQDQMHKPEHLIKVVRQQSMPSHNASPLVTRPIGNEEFSQELFQASPQTQNVPSPGSGSTDKPLPWMIGLRKEEAPYSELEKETQAKQQRIQRQKSLPQQPTPKTTAPWRHSRTSQEVSGSKAGSDSGIIPPPDIFRDQMSPQAQHQWDSNSSHTWQQPSQVYQIPQGKERIIPIMMEETSPVYSPNSSFAPRILKRVPSSPARNESGMSGTFANTPPPSPGSAFMSYNHNYGAREEPHQNGPVVYLQNGGESDPIQSKSFRVIQNAYVGNNSTEQDSQNSPKTYSGSNIPSRSFKALQQMTDNENAFQG